MLYYLISFDKFQKKQFKLPFTKKEFHISKNAIEKYKIQSNLVSLTGNIIFHDTYAIRHFCETFNTYYKTQFSQIINPSEISGMAILDEVKHFIISYYQLNVDNNVLHNLIEYINQQLGEKKLYETLYSFIENFPPSKVLENRIDIKSFLKNKYNFETEFEEMIVLMINNENQAYQKLIELFDQNLLKNTYYFQIKDLIKTYFNKQTKKLHDKNLLQLLYAPQKNSPKSIKNQLIYLKENWGLKLDFLLNKILKNLDLIKEENKSSKGGPGPSKIINFKKSINYEEKEQFSEDKNWMPEVVMIAKSTFVWLFQLSTKYNCQIKTLDQIPDEELITLKKRGFNTLWLIGLWKRSNASKRIKEICGNNEAYASAYSLYDYEIAHELGGEESYYKLKNKCNNIGLRLAADMVPNHFGIDSKWIHNHYERFLSLDNPPFPSYSFNGANLSSNSDFEIKIDDKYYSKEDAAVVFKLWDKKNNITKYIYHGNDGTSMPWNDTAQLDYTNKTVREEIIKTIIEVAKKFPVIRFDAAMTLAKKHYKRLWFPSPGVGGDIASRSDHSLTDEEFNKLMPIEFFREVVDKVAIEAPNTLLLAEAFWLMEGYFVRTLGMHRVYNSAFMNMLKMEENEKYKKSLKNILLFDKDILKRFVNFLSNPDEETSVEQFGKNDKYFGTCMMLATLPGLPMFAHGQIEGYAEKYGMEYKKPYLNEEEDLHFMQRHEKEIFPLLKMRYIFAHSKNFYLFDFFTYNNKINNNVFAYSNSNNGKTILCLYNNKYEQTEGFIEQSAPFIEKRNGKKIEKESNIVNILKIPKDENSYLIFKDMITNIEYMESCNKIHKSGFQFKLNAFKYKVFCDFKIIYDNDGILKKIESQLNNEGCKSIKQLVNNLKYKNAFNLFEQLIFSKNKSKFIENFDKFITELKITNLLKNNVDFEEIKKLNQKFLSINLKNDNEYNIILQAYSLFLTERLNHSICFELKSCNKELIETVQEIFNFFGKKYDNFSNIFSDLIKNKKISSFLKINKFKEIEYFNKEQFQLLLNFILIILYKNDSKQNDKFKKQISKTAEFVNYKVDKFILLV